MITWGISANSHDAAIAVFADDYLVYASHSERYSRVKNDGDLDLVMVNELKAKYGEPDRVVWYENPWSKSFRQLFAGQGWKFHENNVKDYLRKFNIRAPITYKWHHESHAAAGYYTSPFDDATVVVIDSIGEFETISVWQGKGNKLKKLWSQNYPDSVGLWYSAMTDRIGLKANEEEYILMGMAALGDPLRFSGDIIADFVSFDHPSEYGVRFKQNLHKGCKDWRPDLIADFDRYDIAAGTQHVYELIFNKILQDAVRLNPGCKNLVLMGGCALNCVANADAYTYFKNVWIMPNPGDAGSAVGAVLADKRKHIHWPGPYLGYDMGYHTSNDQIVKYLLENKICGLARGRAEYADKIFDMPTGSTPYMQYAVKCLRPDLYPAIVHLDGTSRVQTVTKEDNPEFHALLSEWYFQTGCPLLVNTSLNIKGEPIVNTHEDADRWENKYGIPIFR